jgi:hypothetical protein
MVFPEPGGPQKTIDMIEPDSIAVLSAFPGASRCSWPTNSSSVLGRIRAASGWAVSRADQKVSSLVVGVGAGPRNFFGIGGIKMVQGGSRQLTSLELPAEAASRGCERPAGSRKPSAAYDGTGLPAATGEAGRFGLERDDVALGYVMANLDL